MSAPAEKLDSELESFRRQWLSDLQTKTESEAQSSSEAAARAAASSRHVARPHHHHGPPAPSSPTASKKPLRIDDEDEYVQAQSFDDDRPSSALATSEDDTDRELVSALDHYEEAMEKEAQGNMGDSLKLYRKAYRLDNRVDRRYREKHFPVGTTAPKAPVPNHAPPVQESKAKAPDTQPQSIADLIASFADLKVEPVPPEVEGMPQPPCPISDIPNELLVHIMSDVAADDVGDFARLAQVCKHFAYVVATEQRIWRRVCVGEAFGFEGMHHHWQKAIGWEDLDVLDVSENEGGDDNGGVISIASPDELAARRREQKYQTTLALHPKPFPTWKAMFRSRPRLRFNGCYISTVNYVRTGQASTNQTTWNSPIHIVTYYRYLRFYRDGTCISLLTTTAPSDVVHHLTQELLLLHRDGTHAHLPSAVMALALKGRWRLSSIRDQPEAASVADAEGDLFIETEGTGPKYIHRMDLSLTSAGKGARNNKLVWRGFYSYNKLTDDWGEFGLKNDKPYYFSRVRSYGVGMT